MANRGCHSGDIPHGNVNTASCRYYSANEETYCTYTCHRGYEKTSTYVQCVGSNTWVSTAQHESRPCIPSGKPTFVPPHEHVTTEPITWGPVTFNPNRTTQERTTRGKYESTLKVDKMSVRPEIFLSVMFGGLIVVVLVTFLIFYRAHKRTARRSRSMGIVVFATVDPHPGPPTCPAENPVSPVHTPPAYDDVTQSGPPVYEQINMTGDTNRVHRHKDRDLPPPYFDNSTPAQNLSHTEHNQNSQTRTSYNACTPSTSDTFSSHVDHGNRNEQYKRYWQQPPTGTPSNSHDTVNDPGDDPPPYSMV